MPLIELTLDDLCHGGIGHGGDAVGHYQGKAVFVPLALPGETVRVDLVQDRPRYARARLVKVLQASTERVEPRCPHFGRCGGCHWQHISYEAQLRYKTEIVRSLLQRIGRQPDPQVRSPLGMGIPWSYRNNVQLRVDAAGHLGYYAAKSHDIVPVGRCLLSHPLIERLWADLPKVPPGVRRVILRAGTVSGDQMAILEGAGETPPSREWPLSASCLYAGPSGKMTLLAGQRYLHERLAGRAFRVSARSFFQVNTHQAERLVEVVRRYAALNGEKLLDAYCGVGVLGLTLAAKAGAVLGIESSLWAVKDAVANDRDELITLYRGDVVAVLTDLELSSDAIVLDPPRSGCSPGALEALARCDANRIVYVSCDPATLARDILRLNTHDYELQEVQPVDMFPQTYHIETVALMRKRHKA